MFCLLPPGVALDRLLPAGDHLVLETHSTNTTATCPVCDKPSGQRHSTYRRHLADLPWQGRTVELHLRVSRFRCTTASCPRRIFAERLPAAAPPGQRRTMRLADAQRRIALAPGGKSGARLTTLLAMPVSGATLLRLIRAVPIRDMPAPRVAGIDDGAWRRGRRYGTIIVDLEHGNRPVDLLPDRKAETVAAWLKAHPGVPIAVRDRAGAYAEGVHAGAPEATQVADRWHLLRNLGDALAGILDRHHRAIRVAAKAATAVVTAMAAVSPVSSSEPRPPSRSQQRTLDQRAARQARFDEVAALHARGWSLSAIARTTGLDRGTIGSWLKAGRVPSRSKPAYGSAIDPHAEYPGQRWSEGCTNATRLWREIRDRGCPGRPKTVQEWVRHRLRRTDPMPAGSAPSATAWKVPSGRRAAWLVVADADEIDDTGQKFVGALLAGSPELMSVITLARDFRAMVRRKEAGKPDDWLNAAQETALAGFIGGLKRDPAAVRAALSLPWSTGPVEGRISRLKTIKRTMCGRADFDLLRHRVLEAA
jgi:transposase